MTNYASALKQRAPLSGRPSDVAELLLEPVGAKEDDKANYPNWEFDHWHKQRFYVGGFHWFLLKTGITDISSICDHAAKACELVRSDTNWSSHPAARKEWDAFAGNQIRRAKDRKAQRFPNAAMTIMACESILREMHDSGAIDPSAVSIEDLYSHMTIVPAVWSIADFDKDFFAKNIGNKPGLSHLIIGSSSQHTAEVLSDIVNGYTLTRSSLIDLKSQIKTHAKLECGGLFAKTKDLRNASDHEEIDMAVIVSAA